MEMDAKGEFIVGNQIVGTYGGAPVNVADYNIDQEQAYTEICYFDTDDLCWYFYLIYRSGGPRGGGSTGILTYGYDSFTPESTN